MRCSSRLILWVLMATFLPSDAGAQARTRPPRLIGTVPFAPIPVSGVDGVHIVYELHLTNLDDREALLTRVDVLAEDGTVLLTQEDSILHGNLGRGLLGRTLQGPERARIGGGMSAIIWMWVTAPDATAVPGVLRHRIMLEYEDAAGVKRTAEVEVGTTATGGDPVVLAPPLQGGNWRLGVSNDAGHRRGFESAGTISQRFAIDYSRVDDFGRNSSSDLFANENHYGFGAEVLAVADGVVMAAADTMPENRVGRQPSRSWPATLGNFVDIDIGQGFYALYLHLQSGSVMVQAGDTVERGQVIARLGNTGASVAPHLHFQLNTVPWPAGRLSRGELGEGVPYVHPSYELLGKAPHRFPHCRCEGEACAERPTDIRTYEMPVRRVVVRFPDGSGDEGATGQVAPARQKALCRAAEGRLLRDQRRIPEAVTAYEDARSLDPTLEVPAEDLARLCWNGSLLGYAARVIDACDAAVTAEPEIGDWNRRRGLARALSGDMAGAAADFDAYFAWLSEEHFLVGWQTRLDGLAWGSFEDHRSRIRGWLDALHAGRSPFTATVLDELRSGLLN